MGAAAAVGVNAAVTASSVDELQKAAYELTDAQKEKILAALNGGGGGGKFDNEAKMKAPMHSLAMSAELSLADWLNMMSDSLPTLLKKSEPAIRLVSGNEASDADSIVSALTCAYLCDKGNGDTIPLVMCNREDMPLRRETVLLLEKCGVDASKLFFGNDVAIKELLEKSLVKEVILTDHNQATGIVAPLDKQITTIIDHHKDMEMHAHVTGDARYIAFEGENALAASCATLIAEKFSSDRDVLMRANGAVARALIGVILIDTVNCDPKINKATARDIAVMEALSPLLFESPDGKTILFNELVNAKNDAAFWRTLTVEQCFKYDYKCFDFSGKKVGLSSVLCSLEELSGKDGWSDSLAKLASDVDLYGVATAVRSPDGSFCRQMVLFARDSEFAENAAKFALAYQCPDLQLTAMELSGPPGLKAFNQGNVAASRKQVAPCLAEFCVSLS